MSLPGMEWSSVSIWEQHMSEVWDYHHHHHTTTTTQPPQPGTKWSSVSIINYENNIWERYGAILGGEQQPIYVIILLFSLPW